MKIFLIGLPGSGKTTLGRQLAKALDYSFIDLDAEIERKFNKPVAKIFIDSGEEFFRKQEAQLLKEAIDHHTDFVMATGGGAPCFHSGIDVMSAAGTTIFLDIAIEKISQRMSNEEQKQRPLLSSPNESLQEKLKVLYDQRIAVYRKAKFILTEEEYQVDRIIKMILPPSA